MINNREVILNGLEALIESAEKNKLWLRASYQGITLSPKELRERNARGELIWGPANWRLFNPKELLQDEIEAVAKIRAHNRDIMARIG